MDRSRRKLVYVPNTQRSPQNLDGSYHRNKCRRSGGGIVSKFMGTCKD